MKLAFVVQRYGADIAGGSEAHCREIAERLSTHHDITVLTSCARDYVSWANALPPGEAAINGVRVIRFSVERPRRLKDFADLSDEVFDGDAAPDRQEAWFHENGPIVPALLDHLRHHGSSYDLVLFWTFRYYPSFFGLPLVADRAILLPTAEDDPAVALSVLEQYFQQPAGFLFLTPEEGALVSRRAGRRLEPAATIGIGLEPSAPTGNRRGVLDAQGVPPRFLLYLGRIDRNKGCETLLDYFQEHASASDALPLVLAGPAKMQIPSHPLIRSLGFVSETLREALLAHADALIIPSPYESLSMVLLEGWNHGVPAVVNADCKVLHGQVQRANGGLYYRSSREFSEVLTYLRQDAAARAALGRNGLAYVEREYRWPTVLARVDKLLTTVTSRKAPASA
ncbi:MAG TPA: glycosyltransferase family 4 protein [Vicinamibacterales bacterium]|nr:glycosyltransferase family 4 protein [Vicinamibacterales bacterium]